MLEAAGGDRRLGVCLDSCHLLASGYEIRTPAALGEVIAYLQRGDWAFAEILVVDDQSTDGTADVVRGLVGGAGHLKLLATGGLPAGWVGKNNAAWVGAAEAASPWLLFTDADAEVLPGGVARALENLYGDSDRRRWTWPTSPAEDWTRSGNSV